MMSFHGVLIGAPHSGTGKTIVSLCMGAVLKKKGFDVQPFKVGPDFIDPSHFEYSLGIPSINLDVFMMGEDGLRRSFSRWSEGKNFCLVEGVMGLFDGIGGTDFGSSAHVARILNLPFILVIDVKGMSRSAVAIAEGFRRFNKNLEMAGVILNRVGGDKHRDMLLKAFRESGISVLGTFPEKSDLGVGSRHLGLKMGFEESVKEKKLLEAGENYLDVDGIIEKTIVEPPAFLSDEGEHQSRENRGELKVAIAYDEAFCFYYRDNIEIIKNFSSVEFFSPLRGEFPEADVYYFGGGYPELYLEELSESRTTSKLRSSDTTIYGECGGMMYMSRSIQVEDRNYRMCNLFDMDVILTDKLQAIGYVEGRAIMENPVFSGRFRGHEFHYSRALPDRDVRYSFRVTGKGIEGGMDGIISGSAVGNYTHVHFFSAIPDFLINPL